MHVGQPAERRRKQVDQRHVGQQRAPHPEPEHAAALVAAQAPHLVAVAVQHQCVIAERFLVEPRREQHRHHQPDPRNQPERQRHHQPDHEHHHRDQRIDSAAGGGAAAAHFDIAIAHDGDFFEHHRQGHHGHQQRRGDVDQRQKEHRERNLDQHQQRRGAQFGAAEPVRGPGPAVDGRHHGIDHRLPEQHPDDHPHQHRHQRGPHQMPQHPALGETLHRSRIGHKNVLHTSVIPACDSARAGAMYGLRRLSRGRRRKISLKIVARSSFLRRRARASVDRAHAPTVPPPRRSATQSRTVSTPAACAASAGSTGSHSANTTPPASALRAEISPP